MDGARGWAVRGYSQPTWPRRHQRCGVEFGDNKIINFDGGQDKCRK